MEVKVLTPKQCARAQQKLMGDRSDKFEEGVRVTGSTQRVTIFRVQGWHHGARGEGPYNVPYLLFVLHGKRCTQIPNWQPAPDLDAFARTRWPHLEREYCWKYAYWLLPARETELMINSVYTRMNLC